MNRQELVIFFEEKTARMIEIMKAKNQDYAHDDTDPFGNFRRIEALAIAPAEVGFLTRMTDKIARVASFVKAGELKVKDESVEDTLLDLANYCLLMAAYIKSKHAPAAPHVPQPWKEDFSGVTHARG